MTTLRPPAPVRLAARLLLVAAALGALMSLAAIVALIHLAGARGPYEQAVGLDGDRGVVGKLVWGLTFSLFVALVVAVAGAFLANKLRLPSQAAQTWSSIVAGVAVIAVGCSLVGDPAAVIGETTRSAEAQRLQEALIPSWYGSANTLLALAMLAALVAQAVLLFRPAAQEFYHLGEWEDASATREGA